jgi:hypothetical protein
MEAMTGAREALRWVAEELERRAEIRRAEDFSPILGESAEAKTRRKTLREAASLCRAALSKMGEAQHAQALLRNAHARSEKLLVENDRLRRALEEIAAVDRASAREIARVALKPDGTMGSHYAEWMQ